MATAGTIKAVFTLDIFKHDNPNAVKTYNYVIGGLSLGTITIATNDGDNIAIYQDAVSYTHLLPSTTEVVFLAAST